MILFPAIDIYGGKAVRLLGGEYDKVTVYGDPLTIAKTFEDNGAEWIHVVDLNGAESSGSNYKIIESIATKTSLKIQSGGGLRTFDKVGEFLSSGVSRAVLGTVCVTDEEVTNKIISHYGGEKIVCGLDAKDGKVAVKGWKEKSDLTPADLGRKLMSMGARYFLYTDVSRDGKLTGANIDATDKLTKELNANVIVSGGVKDIEDFVKAKERGIYGAILGKAYYEKKVDLKEALKICMS